MPWWGLPSGITQNDRVFAEDLPSVFALAKHQGEQDALFAQPQVHLA